MEFDPMVARFRATNATHERVITFRMILDPYPPEDWAKKFYNDYPVLPKGVDSWFRNPGIVELDCPLDILRNVKHRLQTFTNEVNIWYGKEVFPALLEQDRQFNESEKNIEEMVDHANAILEEKYGLEGLLFH